MMNDNADSPGDANPSGDATENLTSPAKTPHAAEVDKATSSSDASGVDFKPLPTSRADVVRRERALRRVESNRTIPSWVKKIPWLISWPYMIMRRHDPNYEEHYEHWEEQERRNYDE